MARETPIEWARKMGGWTSAKMLLDVYGHFLPREMQGHADALGRGHTTKRNQGVLG